MFDGSSIEGFVRIEESDMYLYPDLSTWMIFPWSTDRGKIARVIVRFIVQTANLMQPILVTTSSVSWVT